MDRERESRGSTGKDGQGEGGGFFDRPLWRIIIPIILVSFAVQRGVAGVLFYLSEGHPLVIVGYALQTVVALGVAIWIFRGRPRLRVFDSNEQPDRR